MHLSILLIALIIAGLMRLLWVRSSGSWSDRWQRALGAFLVPPILLVVTSGTVLVMGHHGRMLWFPVGWIGCHIAFGFCILIAVLLAYRFRQQWRSLQQVRSLPLCSITTQTGRILETPALFAAQVGFWNPELVVSQGLLQSLTTNQIEAVLRHEAGHFYYHDTFYFFWLGWVRQFTFWLPKTQLLWQELLLLRELRADHWAAQRVDRLTLAETLVLVAKSASAPSSYHGTAFHDIAHIHRLEERINFLLTQSEITQSQCQPWFWLLPITLPALLIPFHY